MATSTIILGFCSIFCFATSFILWGDYFKKKILKKDIDFLVPVLGTKQSGKTILATTLLDEIYNGNALPKGVSGEYLGEKEEKNIKNIPSSLPIYGESICAVDANASLLQKLNDKEWKSIVEKIPYISKKSYIKSKDHNVWHIQDTPGEYKLVLENEKLKLYPLYYTSNKRTTREAVMTEVSRFHNKQHGTESEKENYYLNFVASNIRLKTMFCDTKGEDFQKQSNFDVTGISKLVKNSTGIIFIINSEKFFDAKGQPLAGDEFIANYTYALDQRLEIAQLQKEVLPVWVIFSKGDLFTENIQKLQSSELLEHIPNLRSFEQQEYIHLFTNLISVNKTSHLHKNIPRTFVDFFQQMKENFLQKKAATDKKIRQVRKFAIIFFIFALFLYNETMVNYRYDKLSIIEKQSNYLDREYEYLQRYNEAHFRYASISNIILNNFVYSKQSLLEAKWQNMIIKLMEEIALQESIFKGEDIQEIKDSIHKYDVMFDDEIFIAQVENSIKIYHEWNELKSKLFAEKIYYVKEVLSKKENPYTKNLIKKIRDYITNIVQQELNEILEMKVGFANEKNQTPESFLIEFREWQLKYKSLDFNLVTAKENNQKWQQQLQNIQNVYFENTKENKWLQQDQVTFLIMLYKYFPKKEDAIVPDDVENFLQKTTESILRDEEWKKQGKEKDKIDLMFFYETRYKNDEDIYRELLKNNIYNYLHENDPNKNKYLKETVQDHFDKLKKRLAQKIDDPNTGAETKEQYRKEAEKYQLLEQKFTEMKLTEEITLSFHATSSEFPTIYIYELFVSGQKVNTKYIYSSSIKDKDKPNTCTFPWKPFSTIEIVVYNEDYGADTYLGKYMYPEVFIPENFSGKINEDKIKIEFSIDTNKLISEEIKEMIK